MRRIVMILLATLLFSGFVAGQAAGGDDLAGGYRQIDQETARQMMALDDGHVVVDVRRQDEYDAGHIPGAILIPNESIGCDPPEALPDYDQIILIYCRSGNRSKQAAQKLAGMGYTQIYEFGGINTWTGEIVTGGQPAVLSFHSFDGGGPEYSIVLDSDIVSWKSAREYADANHDELDGAAYQVVFTFTGVKPGEATMTVEERSPIAGNLDHEYAVKVDNDLNVTVDLLTSTDLDAFVQSTPTLVIAANDRVFYAALEDNPSAAAFAEKLSAEAIEVEMRDYGSFEKVGPLPWTLERNDERITTEPGDVILYQGNQITIYYDQNTWDFTRLAKIDGVSREELLDAFGDGTVTVALWVEWSE